MASNHMQQQTEESYAGSGFQPFDFDEEVAPDLHDGDYVMEITEAKARLSNADQQTGVQFPQILLEWTAREALDEAEENQNDVGNTVSEFITLRPKGDRKGNLSKQRLTALRNRFGIDSSVVPAKLTSLDDLNDLCAALKGQTTKMSAKNRVSNDINRTNLNFASDSGGEETTQEEAPKAPAKKPAAQKPAKGNAKKK